MDPFILLCIVGCMVGQAFFCGMETGVISIHRMRLKHFVKKGESGAKMLQDFLDHSDRLLGTTLVGTNIFLVVISVLAASLTNKAFGHASEPLSTIIVSVILLIFCEYLPKSWFRERPLERCRRYVGVLRLSEIVFTPISFVIIGITRMLVPGPRKSLSKPVPFVTREDLKILVKEGEQDGVLSPRERVMINRVIELSGKKARDIMIPRNKMEYVRSDTMLSDFFAKARETGFTRSPVWDEKTDTFVGVINVFYLLSQEADKTRNVSELSRPPLFIPAEMPADDIFPKMRRSHQPLSLVVDESASVIGMITTEDILEEIVGKL